MCGRFAQYSSSKDIQKTFLVNDIACEVLPSYNIAPTHEVVTIVRHDDAKRLGTLHWGLVPAWAKDRSGASKLINARSETAAEKPSFREAFKKRRCLVIADGFYEWQKLERVKQPWYFSLPSGGPFAFAGLWERWSGAEGEQYYSCTILTTSASESVQPVHDRMPVILQPDAIDEWLNPDNRDPAKLKAILRTGHIGALRGYPVARQVNAPSFNEPSCITPVEP